MDTAEQFSRNTRDVSHIRIDAEGKLPKKTRRRLSDPLHSSRPIPDSRMFFKNWVRACDEGTQWTPILTGELERARTIQKDLPLLKSREVEATVLSTFLHSQPIGQKAELADLYLLLAHADIDPMSIEKGLSDWREVSWFLKENESSWALGNDSQPHQYARPCHGEN